MMLQVRRLGQLAARCGGHYTVICRRVGPRAQVLSCIQQHAASKLPVCQPVALRTTAFRGVHTRNGDSTMPPAAFGMQQECVTREEETTAPVNEKKYRTRRSFLGYKPRRDIPANPYLHDVKSLLLEGADPDQVVSVRGELERFKESLVRRQIRKARPGPAQTPPSSQQPEEEQCYQQEAVDITPKFADQGADGSRRPARKTVMPAFLTQELDLLLSQMELNEQFDRVELFCALLDEFLPQTVFNLRQQNVLMQHLSLAMCKQRRFEQLVRLLVWKQHNELDLQQQQEQEKQKRQEKSHSPVFSTSMRPQFVYFRNAMVTQSLLVACNHLKDARSALRVYERVRSNGFNLRIADYFHVMLACLSDESGFFDSDQTRVTCVLAIFDEFLQIFPQERLQFSLIPKMMTQVLDHVYSEMDRVMECFDDVELSQQPKAAAFVEIEMETLLHKLWAHEDQPLCKTRALNVLSKSMPCLAFSRDWKERVSRYLLHEAIVDSTDCSMDQVLDIMQWMQDAGGIAAKTESISVFINRLFDERYATTIEEMDFILQQFPQVIRLSTVTLSEAFFALHRRQEHQLMTQLMIYSLNKHIFIKRQVLETLVGNYYKHRDLHSGVAVIEALQKNKYITMSVRLAALGIKMNWALGRHEQVASLFEESFCRKDAVDAELVANLEKSALYVMKLARDSFDQVGNDERAGQLDFLIKREHRRLDKLLEETQTPPEASA